MEDQKKTSTQLQAYQQTKICMGHPTGQVTELGLSPRIQPQFRQPALEDFCECEFRFNLWGEEKEGYALTLTHPPLHLVPITPQRKRPLQCPTLLCAHRNTWTHHADSGREAKLSVFWYQIVPKESFRYFTCWWQWLNTHLQHLRRVTNT